MSYTHGPWQIHKMPTGQLLIFAGEINVAGTAHKGFGPNDEKVEAANARLIAAAPDLLEAARRVLAGSMVSNDPTKAALKALAAAIAKATDKDT